MMAANGHKIGPRRINYCLLRLQDLFRTAHDRGVIPTNPMKRVKLLREGKPQIDPLSFEEVGMFLKTVREDFRHYFLVAFFTGMRPDEQLALKWPQVDFVQKKISIRESRVRGFEGPPKTEASEREIDLLPMVEQALLAQWEVSVNRSAYVFCSKVNGPLDICNLRERVWKPTLKAAGLRMRHFYNTRHTFASLMLGSGENIGWVARMMGHKDIQMVLKRYHKFIPNLTRRDGSAFLEKAAQWGFVTSP